MELSKRCIVNVATGEHYGRGQTRLLQSPHLGDAGVLAYRDVLPQGCPRHEDRPYAFKAYAMQEAWKRGYSSIMWCDACILPQRSLEPIWEHAAEHGVWLSRNGWDNDQWTADHAYRYLFPNMNYDEARKLNRQIPHVVATAFAVDLSHPNGRSFLKQYLLLAFDTEAFCGPWINGVPGEPGTDRQWYCGPTDRVLGHRHDQTCASVLAHNLGIPLTEPPKFFAYRPGDETTILLADGAYV